MKKVTVMRPVAYKWIERIQTPNSLYRETITEFLGTFILILLIDSALATGILTGNHQTLLYVSLAGGVGLYLGFVIGGPTYYAQLNPAVTIPLVTLRKIDWKRAPCYILAQLLGAFLASAVVYFQYYPYFMNLKNKPAKYTVNALHSMPGPSTNIESTIIDQIACVGLLMIALLGLTDKCNKHNHRHSAPLGFIFVLAALIMSFGLQSCAINPARELAGRLFSVIIGLGDHSFTPLNSLFWLFSGIVGPIAGGLIGSWLYYLLIEIHSIDEDLQREEIDVSTQAPEREKESLKDTPKDSSNA